MNGIVDFDRRLTLKSSSPRLILVPDELIIPAGRQIASFTFNAPEDSLIDGDTTVTVSGFLEGSRVTMFQTAVLDNDNSGFEVELPELVERGGEHLMLIRAVHEDGTLVAPYAGSASVVLYDPKTATEIGVLASDVKFTNGIGTIAVTFPVAPHGDSVLVRGRDGAQTILGPFRFFHKIVFPANDIVADSSSGKVLAVAGGNAMSGYQNSLTSIDPDEGLLDDPVFLGNEPVVLAITAGGEYVYAGLASSHSIAKIDMASGSVVSSFVLKSTISGRDDPFRPTQILTIPGRPHDVIVSQAQVWSTYSAVNAYFNGVLQSSGQSHNEWSLLWGAAPDQFFGYDYKGSSGFQLHHCRLTAAGFVSVRQGVPFNLGFASLGYSTRIAGGNNILFSNYGRVVDGSTFNVLGDIPLPFTVQTGVPYVTFDPSTSRVIFTRGNEGAIFDARVFELFKTFKVPNIGGILKIIRYGPCGMAFRTDKGEIVFLNDPTLIPASDPVDLAVGIRSNVEEATLGVAHRYSFHVTNLSQVIAQDVTLRLRLGDAQCFSPGTTNLTPGSVQEVVHTLGDLAPGRGVTIHASAEPQRLTLLTATAAVTTSSLDKDYENNTAVQHLEAVFESRPNSIKVVEVPAVEVLTRPMSGELVVATRYTARPDLANSLALVNPCNGSILRTVNLPGAVTKLAISEDGSLVYALSEARNVIYKAALTTNSLVQTLSFPDLTIEDFDVLRGTPDSIVIGTGFDGVRVYDNGVLRPNTSGFCEGDELELLPDPLLIFAYNTKHPGFECFKYRIRNDGVEMQDERAGLLSGFINKLESDGYYVYSSSGTVIRADIMAADGTFDINSAFGPLYHFEGPHGLEPDRDLQRVYFSGGPRIISFDTQSYLKVREISFPELSASRNIKSLTRWGSDGFAAILDNHYLAIIRSEIVPSQPGPIDFIVSPGDGEVVREAGLEIVGKTFSGHGIASISVNGQQITSTNGYANWETELTLNPGLNPLAFEITLGEGGSAVKRTITVTYVPPVAGMLKAKAQAWLGMSNLPNGWESADQDSDGYSLQYEILHGMNHLKPDEPLLVSTWKTAGDGESTFAYRRLKCIGACYTLQASDDLRSWSGSYPQVRYVGSPSTFAADPDYEDVHFQVSIAEHSRLFLRLAVAQD